jgi:tRNA1(Val) A37 N6-methylase TrmN6
MNLDELSLDYFIEESCKIYQHKKHFHFNTDTALLAKFMEIKKGERVLDIGTNNGVLLVYADRFAPKKLMGVEVLSEACEVARVNKQFIQSDFALYEMPVQQLEIDQVDVIITNPPYFPLEASHPNLQMSPRQLGRVEINCDLKDLIENASRLLKSKGRFYMVHRPGRINEIYALMLANRLQPKRISIAYDARTNQPRSLLMEAIKEGNNQAVFTEPVWIAQSN